MSEQSESLRKAVVLIQKLKQKVTDLEGLMTEPVAIVGMGCRFPGESNDLQSFWSVLANGVDCVSMVPETRWNASEYYDETPRTIGKFNTRQGAFIGNTDLFDAEFFNISSDEAAAMDPQQRILLETAVEAIQDAGLPLATLAGSNTGVFIGMGSDKIDYLWSQPRDYRAINAYSGVGTAHNGASGRLSYFLNTNGPSLTFDSACSSSLVATHYAIKSLRSRECDLAVVGGVSLMLSPLVHVMCGQMQLLAPDGRCKPFSVDADGFGRGEGAGILILKRLSDALAANDRIHAVLKGSAINHNGKSNGLTSPNQLAQQQVMMKAIADAHDVSGSDISYVEAHGTGSSIGDALEMEAIKAVYCGSDSASNNTCYLGTVKANMGHLEAAAGVCSVIKTVLAIKHKKIPPHINYRELHPNICLKNSRFKITKTLQDWRSQPEKLRTAGVSAFGWTGQNAHLIIQEYNVSGNEHDTLEQEFLLPLSAKNETALNELIACYALELGSDKRSLHALVAGAALNRDHFEYRACFVGRSGEELKRVLQQNIQTSDRTRRLHTSQVQANRLALIVYGELDDSGIEIAKEFYARYKIFQKTIDEGMGYLAEIDRGMSDSGPLKMEDMEMLMAFVKSYQDAPTKDARAPLTLIFQVALLNTLNAWGVSFKNLSGFGIGLLSAAVAATAVSLPQAIAVVSKSQDRLLVNVRKQSCRLICPITLSDVPHLDVKLIEETTYFTPNQLETLVQLLRCDSDFLIHLGTGMEMKVSPSEYVIFSEYHHACSLDGLIARIYELGRSIDWRKRIVNAPAFDDLPLYPWQRCRYWF